jgi:hypothetical protein
MLAYCCKTTSKFIYSSNEIILKTKIKKKKSTTSSNITITPFGNAVAAAIESKY